MNVVIAAWILVGLALALSARLLEEALWVLASLPVLGWGLAGFAILTVVLWNALERGSRHRVSRRAAAMVATALAFPFVTSLGEELTVRGRFWRERPAYERVISRLEPDLSKAAYGRNMEGLDFIVDAGPPMRVAFVWPGGILDN